MTITDLKKYSDQISVLPTDRMMVTLDREGVVYIGAFLKDRIKSMTQSLSDPHISEKKRTKREYELNMLKSAYQSILKATKIIE